MTTNPDKEALEEQEQLRIKIGRILDQYIYDFKKAKEYQQNYVIKVPDKYYRVLEIEALLHTHALKARLADLRYLLQDLHTLPPSDQTFEAISKRLELGGENLRIVLKRIFELEAELEAQLKEGK
jgi:hypothetical protein